MVNRVIEANVEALAEMLPHERVAWMQARTGHNPWGSTDWPRDKAGRYLPHTGYALGLRDWMSHNERA